MLSRPEIGYGHTPSLDDGAVWSLVYWESRRSAKLSCYVTQNVMNKK
jgi:hypothetical protein